MWFKNVGEQKDCKTYDDLDAGSVGHKLLDLGKGLFESRGGNIGEEDAGTLLGEEDGGFETNTTIWKDKVLASEPWYSGVLKEGGHCILLTQQHQ